MNRLLLLLFFSCNIPKGVVFLLFGHQVVSVRYLEALLPCSQNRASKISPSLGHKHMSFQKSSQHCRTNETSLPKLLVEKYAWLEYSDLFCLCALDNSWLVFALCRHLDHFTKHTEMAIMLLNPSLKCFMKEANEYVEEPMKGLIACLDEESFVL
ncbi:hypothetical protein AMECASPLE_017809 [Ameca splendens]|uniref:Uncharacterized protein n=1 Tax=Ameca splendens TaxID=208324 RepID=A0ABV0YDN4_9TELE